MDFGMYKSTPHSIIFKKCAKFETMGSNTI